MAKRSKAPAPTLIEEAPAPSIAVHEDEGGARGCMSPPVYNAAIKVQVALRDGLARSIGLQDALEIAAEIVAGTLKSKSAASIARGNFDRMVEERELARLIEQKRISALAGKETGR